MVRKELQMNKRKERKQGDNLYKSPGTNQSYAKRFRNRICHFFLF